MMFEDVVMLYENYLKYIKEDQFTLQNAKSSLNMFFDHTVRNFESEVNTKSHEELKEQFDRISVPLDFKK